MDRPAPVPTHHKKMEVNGFLAAEEYALCVAKATHSIRRFNNTSSELNLMDALPNPNGIPMS